MVKYIQTKRLDGSPSYKQYLARAKCIYDNIINSNPKWDYRSYQYEMAALYCIRKNNICAGDMGVGKSIITAINIATRYSNLNRPGLVHIAAPNKLSLKSRWYQDLNRVTELEGKIELIEHPKQILTSKAAIWLYTVDFIKRKCPYYDKTLAHLIKRRKRLPDLIVIDEAHLVKPDTKRASIWTKYVKQIPKHLLISGTLSDGRLDLMYFMWKLCYGDTIKFNEKSFRDEFSIRTSISTNYLGGKEKLIDVEPRYLNELAVDKVPLYTSLARQYLHRVSYEDPNVASSVTLPKYITESIVVVPSLEHRQEYKKLIESYKTLTVLAGQDKLGYEALNLLYPLIECSNIPTIGQNNKLGKLKYLISQNPTKTVVYTNTVATARYIHKELSNNFNCIRVYAQDKEVTPRIMSVNKREEAINKFLFDPAIQVGIFSIHLVAESIDLNIAEQVLFYDLPWQALKVTQAIYRVVRPGNPNSTVKVKVLSNAGMIDQHQYELYASKVANANLLIDTIPKNSNIKTIDAAELIRRTLVLKGDLWRDLI